jgi:hypothetical protein
MEFSKFPYLFFSLRYKFSPPEICSYTVPLICIVRVESDQVLHPHKTAHKTVVFSIFILKSFRKGHVIIKYLRITHDVSIPTGQKLFHTLICLSAAWTIWHENEILWTSETSETVQNFQQHRRDKFKSAVKHDVFANVVFIFSALSSYYTSPHFDLI